MDRQDGLWAHSRRDPCILGQRRAQHLHKSNHCQKKIYKSNPGACLPHSLPDVSMPTGGLTSSSLTSNPTTMGLLGLRLGRKPCSTCRCWQQRHSRVSFPYWRRCHGLHLRPSSSTGETLGFVLWIGCDNVTISISFLKAPSCSLAVSLWLALLMLATVVVLACHSTSGLVGFSCVVHYVGSSIPFSLFNKPFPHHLAFMYCIVPSPVLIIVPSINEMIHKLCVFAKKQISYLCP